MKNEIMNDDVTASYKQFDFSLAGGPGINFSKQISLETRYIFGLSQINKNPGISGSSYNRTFQLNLLFWLK